MELYKKYKETYPNKTDAQIIEALGWELKDKVETIGRLLKEKQNPSQSASIREYLKENLDVNVHVEGMSVKVSLFIENEHISSSSDSISIRRRDIENYI
jgi:hypothetical protein